MQVATRTEHERHSGQRPRRCGDKRVSVERARQNCRVQIQSDAPGMNRQGAAGIFLFATHSGKQGCRTLEPRAIGYLR